MSYIGKGLSIGVIGLTFQFVIAAQEGYKLLSAAKKTGEDADKLHVLMGFEQMRSRFNHSRRSSLH
jgi:hypothetical protein